MSECEICRGCKCAEVLILTKKLKRLEQLHNELLNVSYYLVDKLEEEKKCR